MLKIGRSNGRLFSPVRRRLRRTEAILDPSTIDSANFTLGITDYFSGTYFTDTGLTTPASDGSSVAGVNNSGSGLNGHAILQADGTDDYLRGGANGSELLTAGRTYSAIVAAYIDSQPHTMPAELMGRDSVS